MTKIFYRDKKPVPTLNPTIQPGGLVKYWHKIGTVIVPNVSVGDVLTPRAHYTLANNQSFIFEHISMVTVSPETLPDLCILNPWTGYDLDVPTKYGMGLVDGWGKIPYNGQNLTPNPGQHYDSPYLEANYVADADHDELHFTLWIKLASSQANGTQTAIVHQDQTFFEVAHDVGALATVVYQEPEVIPPEEWEETYSVENTLDAGTLTNRGLRVILPASKISISGTKARITLQAPTVSGHTTYISTCYIAEKGTGYAPAHTPIQVKFSGNAGVTIAYGAADVVSDTISMAIDETKDYILFFGCGSSVGYGARTDAPLTNAYHKANASGDGLNMSPTGYTHDTACGEYIIKKMEVS